MIASLLRWIALAYGAQRQAARNLLSNQPSTGDALLMILAGTVLIAAAGVLAELIAGRSLAAAMLEGMQKLQAELDVPGAEAGVTAYAPPPLADKLVAVATAIAEGAVLTILTGAAAFGIGKLFRGKASLAECLAVTGLSSIVRAPAELLAMLALLLMPPESFAFGSSIGLGLALVLLYQFSAFVAEAHGFRSVGAVMGMTLGVSLTVMSIFMAMAAGPMTAGPT